VWLGHYTAPGERQGTEWGNAGKAFYCYGYDRARHLGPDIAREGPGDARRPAPREVTVQRLEQIANASRFFELSQLRGDAVDRIRVARRALLVNAILEATIVEAAGLQRIMRPREESSRNQSLPCKDRDSLMASRRAPTLLCSYGVP